MRTLLSMFLLLAVAFQSNAENGRQLWLRPTSNNPVKVVCKKSSPTLEIAKQELQQGWQGASNASVELILKTDKAIKGDGFKLGAASVQANTEQGLLYGVYELLRRQQTGQSIEEMVSNPAFDYRIINHWDNLNGTVERGYAGYSIFWKRTENALEVSEDDKTMWQQYARANASVGINGTVINNVNASPTVLSTEVLQRVKAVSEIMLPYGIKTYLSVNFSSPKVIGGLENSDPLNPEVVKWWKEKTKEIYALIPNFGGFLVKANSEGQPGPQDYGRTHADGANMLADALKPFGGIVMWRAFVYEPGNNDRALQAYNEFMPLDGQFRENVIIQVKNGPIDFQPREPFSPLFGAMQKTPVMIEFQITQEYLGFSDHLAYLSTMWKEVLDADTWAKGPGSTVAKTTDGSLFPQTLTAIAGVANIGLDENWTGHHFGQANWYAFGRLAWDYSLTSESIASEWIKMTFSKDPNFVNPVMEIMMQSREAVVNYMTPLGLHHLMGWSHHHGPEPWTAIPGARPDWLPSYYHRASENGIGFDRSNSGSNAAAQYFSPLKEVYNSPQTCPENLLLWFHHLPWDYRLINGKTLWDNLVHSYYTGVEEARLFQKQWDQLEGMIDEQRFKHIQHKLKIQTREAIWWRDACLLYFQTYSKKPIPAAYERPIHDLDELKKLKFDMLHHN